MTNRGIVAGRRGYIQSVGPQAWGSGTITGAPLYGGLTTGDQATNACSTSQCSTHAPHALAARRIGINPFELKFGIRRAIDVGDFAARHAATVERGFHVGTTAGLAIKTCQPGRRKIRFHRLAGQLQLRKIPKQNHLYDISVSLEAGRVEIERRLLVTGDRHPLSRTCRPRGQNNETKRKKAQRTTGCEAMPKIHAFSHVNARSSSPHILPPRLFHSGRQPSTARAMAWA